MGSGRACVARTSSAEDIEPADDPGAEARNSSLRAMTEDILEISLEYPAAFQSSLMRVVRDRQLVCSRRTRSTNDVPLYRVQRWNKVSTGPWLEDLSWTKLMSSVKMSATGLAFSLVHGDGVPPTVTRPCISRRHSLAGCRRASKCVLSEAVTMPNGGLAGLPGLLPCERKSRSLIAQPMELQRQAPIEVLIANRTTFPCRVNILLDNASVLEALEFIIFPKDSGSLYQRLTVPPDAVLLMMTFTMGYQSIRVLSPRLDDLAYVCVIRVWTPASADDVASLCCFSQKSQGQFRATLCQRGSKPRHLLFDEISSSMFPEAT